jgi:hypothetical protein
MLKVLLTVHSVDDCILLKSDTERIRGWCTAYSMKWKSSWLLVALGGGGGGGGGGEEGRKKSKGKAIPLQALTFPGG